MGLADEIRSRPMYEMVGGPLDGATFHVPADRTEIRWLQVENPVVDVYVRDEGMNKFRYKQRVLDERNKKRTS